MSSIPGSVGYISMLTKPTINWVTSGFIWVHMVLHEIVLKRKNRIADKRLIHSVEDPGHVKERLFCEGDF